MARMRTLKPEAASSESLAEVDRGVRWTFGMFWTHCDDAGRAVWNLRLIKAAIYPLDDNITIDVLADDFDQLERIGAVCRYAIDGKQYVHVPAFGEHQHPNRKVESKLPECPKADHSASTHCSSSEPAVSTHEHATPVVVVVEAGSGTGEVVGEGADSATTARKRATRIPPDWEPPADHVEQLRAAGIPDDYANRELANFRDYWSAKSGKDATKVDWPATWRVWMRNAIARNPPRGAAPTRHDDNLAVVERLRRQEEQQHRGITA